MKLTMTNYYLSKFFLSKFFIIFLILPSIVAANSYFPKNNLSVLGKNTESVGLGGVLYGIGELNESLMDNIPLSGGLLRKQFSLGSGIYGGSYNELNLGYFHPTSVGVFSGFYSQFIDPDDENYFFYFSSGFAKEIVDNLFFGFRLNFNYYYLDRATTSNQIALTGDIGLVFNPPVEVKSDFFVFRKLVVGGGIRNAGFIPNARIEKNNTSEIYALGQSDFIRLGTGFDFIHFKLAPRQEYYWDSRFMIEAALIFPPVREGVNLGWKNTFTFEEIFFRSFYVSLGYFHNPNLGRNLPLTTGLGFSFLFDELEFDINYAMVLARDDLRSIHYKFSLEFRFGELDEEAPFIDTSKFSQSGTIEDGVIE